MFYRDGIGALTIQAAATVTLATLTNPAGTLGGSVSIASQGGKAWAWKVGATKYQVWGDI